MARRVSASQLRSLLRQAEEKRRQAINRYNDAVRKYNSDLRRAVDNYNREVRAHNARVQDRRRKLRTAIARLSAATAPRYVSYQRSVQTLHSSYTRLEEASATRPLSAEEEDLFNLSHRETSRSVQVVEALSGDTDSYEDEEQSDTAIVDELRNVSPDLDNRWRGAVFALNPRNPDAARHFCTSAREIFTQLIEAFAPAQQVLATLPTAQLTEAGAPTRRAKLHYLLVRKGIHNDALAQFADDDLDNVLELFRVFNDGTHGAAGVFSHRQLLAIRRRVESGLQYLCRLAA